MIVPKNIFVKDFLSIEEVDFDFEEGKTFPLFGLNKTDPGKESNGSGKSAFQQAIEYGLRRNTSRYSGDSLLIRRGEEEAVIIITLFNTVKNETIILDHTIRKRGSSCEISITDKDGHTKPVEVSGLNEARDWIISYIDISVEDLSSFYLPNERNYVPFFTGSNTKKVELISRLSNSLMVDNAIKAVSEEIDNTDSSISKFDTKVGALESRISVYEEEITKINPEEFEKLKQQSIIRLNQRIREVNLSNGDLLKRVEGLQDRIGNSKKELQPIQEKIKEVEFELESLPKTDHITKEIEKLDEVRSEFVSMRSNVRSQYKNEDDALKKLFRKKSEFENILSGEITCPKCSHKFLLREDISIEEVKENLFVTLKVIDSKNILLQNLNDTITEIETNTSDVDKMIEVESGKISKVSKERSSLSSKIHELKFGIQKIIQSNETASIQIDGYLNQIKLNEEEVKVLSKQIKEKEAEEFDDSKIEEFRKQIEDTKSEIKSVGKEKVKSEQGLMTLKAWLIHFKKFKSYIANRQLKIIQGLANTQLKAMGTDIQIKIEGFRTLASGEIREQITGYIIENGDIAEYKEFSKGERARIDYAMILAMQNLCNSSSKNGGLDLLFADEISEGIDPIGNEFLLEAIGKTGRTSLIVSHVATNTPEGEAIFAIKENGVTNIERGQRYEIEKRYQDSAN